MLTAHLCPCYPSPSPLPLGRQRTPIGPKGDKGTQIQGDGDLVEVLLGLLLFS